MLFDRIAGLLARIDADRALDGAETSSIEAHGDQALEDARGQLAAIVAEGRARDLWANRARPTFLYVMYALLLWSIPMGLIAAVRPQVAAAITRGMSAYLAAIPEPLYALFGTGYLGYTVAREWGKAKAAG